ncbi:MAG TPA: type III-A CRISPR-associated RAMP protein Csm3 [Candidatus Paceibacterota bacterium]|nr:type III-A CRISPR-associated RAMP protein Csm3 [Candidatus Paceibacterota bacterium]
MKTLLKKIKVTTTLELITGLHVGGSKENVEIGGIDNPVIRTAIKDNQPYIPGSSLKGKIRSLLEQIAGSPKVGDNEEINDLFGFANSNKPSKIIVRDSYLLEKSAKLLVESENLDMPYTEGKWENVIHRIKGTAEHPRQTERIPAGVSFGVEFIINVWDNEDDGKKSLEMLKKGIAALENDYLGGSGSRGYGQVKFSELQSEDIPFEKYFEHEN